MKKLLALIIVAIICLSLIACGSNEESTVNEANNLPAEQPVDETNNPSTEQLVDETNYPSTEQLVDETNYPSTEQPVDETTEGKEETEVETEEFDGPDVYLYLYNYAETKAEYENGWSSAEECANDLYEQVVNYYQEYHNETIFAIVKNFTERGRDENFFDIDDFSDYIYEGEACYGCDAEILYHSQFKLLVFEDADWGSLEYELNAKYEGELEWDIPAWHFYGCDYLIVFIAETIN